MEQMTTTTPSSNQRPALPTRMAACCTSGRPPHAPLRVGGSTAEIEDQQVLVHVRATWVNRPSGTA